MGRSGHFRVSQRDYGTVKIRDFLDSKWVRAARDPRVQAQVAENLPRWQQQIKNTGLLKKSRQLWEVLTGNKTTRTEKVLIFGALLYLLSPVDAVPDVFPVLGWLDDLGVAGLVLGYLTRKLDSTEVEEVPTDRKDP